MNSQSLNTKRIVLITAQEKTTAVEHQIHKFKMNSIDVEDRKIAVFTKIAGELKPIINTNESSLEFLKQQVSKFDETVQMQSYLIGLDQGIKKVITGVVDPKTVFDIIDRMPMRKAEMRRRGK